MCGFYPNAFYFNQLILCNHFEKSYKLMVSPPFNFTKVNSEDHQPYEMNIVENHTFCFSLTNKN